MKAAFNGLLLALILDAGTASAFGDQWYIGIGGGASSLDPSAQDDVSDLDDDEAIGTAGTLILGRDLDIKSSIELQLRSLGTASFENEDEVDYYSADAALLYRLVDSRGDNARQGGPGAALYGRFALGFIERDSELELDNDNPINFGAGAGVEIYLHPNIALRGEGIYHDRDAASATLSLIGRFGGQRIRPLPPMPEDLQETVASLPPRPAATRAPAAVAEDGDKPNLPPGAARIQSGTSSTATASPAGTDHDRDGVNDYRDRCLDSPAGYPVQQDGCALFDGVLSGVVFKPDSAVLESVAFDQLELLAGLLREYPRSNITLMAHTDNQGSPSEAARLTRERLRTIGSWLVEQGISARRLNLRAFGDKQPLYDNTTSEGRRRNNRIEVLEYLPR